LKFIFFNELLNIKNFLNCDAEHYLWIKEYGYEGFRVAFFPLFPIIWKLLNVNITGIVLINGVLFLSSFYILIRDLKTSVYETIIYISIPSFIFFFLPYTESIFFLCSTLLILGLKYNKTLFICLGLFFATLSRPAFTIFIPALIISELLSENRNKLFLRLSLYFSVTLIGILLVAIIQYNDTLEWFKFFSVQKVWGNELQIPKLPLRSWTGGFIARLDGAALFIGVLTGSFLTALILKFKQFKKIKISKEVIFSLAYLGGVSLSVLFFRAGSLFSLNRFVFATPFIIIVFNFWIKYNFSINLKQLLFIFVFIFLFWLLFDSYANIQTLLKYLLVSVYLLLIFIIKSDKILLGKIAMLLLIVLNIIFQVILYVRFLNGGWVG